MKLLSSTFFTLKTVASLVRFQLKTTLLVFQSKRDLEAGVTPRDFPEYLSEYCLMGLALLMNVVTGSKTQLSSLLHLEKKEKEMLVVSGLSSEWHLVS